MFYRRKSVPRNIAARALIALACMAVIFGSSVGVLLPSLLIAKVQVVEDATPTQQSSVPESAPEESRNPDEPTKEGEASSLSLRRKVQKTSKTHVHLVGVAGLEVCKLRPAQAVFVGSQSPVGQSEYCYRNGCGAHLRF